MTDTVGKRAAQKYYSTIPSKRQQRIRTYNMYVHESARFPWSHIPRPRSLGGGNLTLSSMSRTLATIRSSGARMNVAGGKPLTPTAAALEAGVGMATRERVRGSVYLRKVAKKNGKEKLSKRRAQRQPDTPPPRTPL